MTIDFMRLIFIWLLPLAASSAVTPGPNHSSTAPTTGEVIGQKISHNQPTTRDTSSLHPLSEVSGLNSTPSTAADVTPTEEKTSTKPSLQPTSASPERFLPNIQTPATPTTSISRSTGIRSTTEVQSKVRTSTATVGPSHASYATKPTPVSPTQSNSAQSRGAGQTSTSRFTRDKITRPSSPRPTTVISTANTSTQPETDKSDRTSPVTVTDSTQSKGPYKTSATIPFIHVTTAKKKKDPSGKKPNSDEGTNHGKIVAGLIGGALVFMMVGFLVIYMKKRKLQKQQITTTDWAGPSPFLDGGADNGKVTLRSSNRISLSSFLPQRLSKRLSLLPETDEELQDMTPGTTFGGKHQAGTFVQEADESDAQESNGSAAVPEIKNPGGATDTAVNSVSATSLDANEPPSANNNPEVANLSQDQTADLSNPSGAVENPPPQMSNGTGQP